MVIVTLLKFNIFLRSTIFMHCYEVSMHIRVRYFGRKLVELLKYFIYLL